MTAHTSRPAAAHTTAPSTDTGYRPRPWRTAIVAAAVAGVALAVLLVPVHDLLPAVAAIAFVAMMIAVARWTARDGFSVREPRPGDPHDLLSARLVGFRD